MNDPNEHFVGGVNFLAVHCKEVVAISYMSHGKEERAGNCHKWNEA